VSDPAARPCEPDGTEPHQPEGHRTADDAAPHEPEEHRTADDTAPHEPAPSDEVVLPGGNVGGAVRVGSTVRRRTGPWTPAVHDLLRHLAERGLDAVPTVHGLDDRDREVLDFLPGEVLDVDVDVLGEERLAATGRWLRRFHDEVTDLAPGRRRWYFVERDLEPDELICHNDLAPYNIAYDGDRVAGVFDWDLAGPGRPVDDLAFLAWSAVPLFRPVPGTDAAWLTRRLTVLDDAYGAGLGPTRLAVAALERLRTAAGRIEAGQAAGDAGMLRLAEAGEPARTRTRLADARTRLGLRLDTG